MQVVNALIKANKTFDLLVIPGRRRTARAAPYGERKRYDFFVQHLLGMTPPAWNEIKAKAETTARDEQRGLARGAGSGSPWTRARLDRSASAVPTAGSGTFVQ